MKSCIGACLILALAGARTLRADPADTVVLRGGDQIKGRIIRLTKDKIEFSVPTSADALTFSLPGVARVEMTPRESDAAPARLILNTGVEVSGKIVSMSEDAIVIASSSLGRLSIPRKSLLRITNGGSIVESRFDKGDLKPWQAAAGTKCAFENGGLVLSSEGAPRRGGPVKMATLELPLKQDRVVTLVAEFESPQQLTCVFAELFVEKQADQRPALPVGFENGIMLLLAQQACVVVVRKNQLVLAAQPQAVDFGKGPARITISYDPVDGTTRAWYKDKLISKVKVSDGPQKGEFVIFGAMRPTSVRRLAVYSGFPAPEDLGPALKPGEVIGYLPNGDAVRASALAFADGNLIFTTEFGPLKVPAEKIRGVEFPPPAEKPPESADAWIETEGARFPLEIQEITDEAIIGKSRDFGDVKIARKFVKSIVFPAAPTP